MYSLEVIKAINRKAAKPTRATCDHSSYTGTIETGIILHSGKHRETRRLVGTHARNFVRAWLDVPAELVGKGHRRVSSQDIWTRRDELVESYF